MDLKFFPLEYPTVFSGDVKRWVDEDFYEDLNIITQDRYHRTLAYQYNTEFLLVFLTTEPLIGVEDTEMMYHMYSMEFGVLEGDIFIHDFIYISSINAPPDFSEGGNFAAKDLMRQKEVRNYQQYERFYVGKKRMMSDIKNNMLEIASGYWYEDKNVSSF